jgi:hypothetical protein
MSPIPPSAVSGADIEGTSHLPTRAAKEPAANVEYTSGELVAVVELHLALGTVDVVSPNVRQMVGVYRRIVRTWLEPPSSGGRRPESALHGMRRGVQLRGLPAGRLLPSGTHRVRLEPAGAAVMTATRSLPRRFGASRRDQALAEQAPASQGPPAVKPLSARDPQLSDTAADHAESASPGTRVVGYLRLVTGAAWVNGERVLQEAAAARGYHLVDIVRSTDVSTLTTACPGILQILDLVDRGEVEGVLTLASHTIAWDGEVVERVATRIGEASAFLDFVWGASATPAAKNRVEGAR